MAFIDIPSMKNNKCNSVHVCKISQIFPGLISCKSYIYPFLQVHQTARSNVLILFDSEGTVVHTDFVF